jgi:hypothetical protein
MGMAAPKGTQAPAAGLAAIAQPAQAPKGMTSGSMAQIMAMARKMSDGQLAEVLQGKSLSVPQYVAMTEAMGRKSLRTAMQGQQAMAQAQQPSVKDKLLMGDQPQMQGIQQGMPQMPQQPVMAASGGLMYADGGAIDMNEGQAAGGLAELPAPNMEGLTLAGGGIVAFDEGGEVPRFNQGGEPLTLEQIDELRTRGSLRRKDEDIPENFLKGFGVSQRSRPYMDAQKNAMREAIAAAPKVTTAQAMQQDMENAAPGTILTAPPAPTDKPSSAPKLPPVVTPGAPKADKERAGLGATNEFSSYMDAIKQNNADYLSKLEGASAKQREGLAKLRSQGGGEALIQFAKGLLGSPTLAQGASKGLEGVASTAAASRKEQRAVEQGADEYDLNLAKARQAAAKGDMESALMFKRLADEAVYRKDYLGIQRAQLNKPGESMQLLNAIRKPGESLSDAYARMQSMQALKKGELYSIDKAVDDFNNATKDKFSAEAKRLKALGITNPYQYQQYVLSQGGGGVSSNPFQSIASAEAQKRGI